ncbi:small regulatory polypeptide of amino acid response isoform X2 [Zalophus californianus]|uniref:Small regulatory polypeptide of amino acid response isoform X2 n=1 Tax=Zalophus californianus TaxID=9704 RepID=A0A6J2EUI3_ZALCA|nr:small regulatory polypeptide of amino acid response isoform X2 [Zalophus californianus]
MSGPWPGLWGGPHVRRPRHRVQPALSLGEARALSQPHVEKEAESKGPQPLPKAPWPSWCPCSAPSPTLPRVEEPRLSERMQPFWRTYSAAWPGSALTRSGQVENPTAQGWNGAGVRGCGPLRVRGVLSSHLSGQLFFQKLPVELTTALGILARGLENSNRQQLRSDGAMRSARRPGGAVTRGLRPASARSPQGVRLEEQGACYPPEPPVSGGELRL